MKTLIFDFDGTLADTQQGIVQSVNAALAHMGYPTADSDAITPLIGLSLEHTFATLIGCEESQLPSDVAEVYRRLYDEISPETLRLFPSVGETLELLVQRGYVLGVASSKGHEALDWQLARTGLARYFTTVVAAQDVTRFKPAPDMALLVLRNTHGSPDEAMVIGDTEYDIAMGRAAGCRTCGVTYGNHSAERLLAAGADHVISSFDALAEICL